METDVKSAYVKRVIAFIWQAKGIN